MITNDVWEVSLEKDAIIKRIIDYDHNNLSSGAERDWVLLRLVNWFQKGLKVYGSAAKPQA